MQEPFLIYKPFSRANYTKNICICKGSTERICSAMCHLQPPGAVAPTLRRRLKLAVVKLRVKTALFYQFAMAPLFDNIPIFHNKYDIGIHYG